MIFFKWYFTKSDSGDYLKFSKDLVSVSEIANLPTKFGKFKIQAFLEISTGKEHVALFTENLSTLQNPLLRIHSECLTGDGFGSLKCDCGEQLDFALKKIADEGGILIYLRQEGRNIGLLNKVNAYALQDTGLDTVEANHQLGFEADARSYEMADFILNFLNIKTVKLLTNNPDKIKKVDVKVIERIPIIIMSNSYNEKYFKTKKEEMGHLF
jgi:GTP cyclohydrolase II